MQSIHSQPETREWGEFNAHLATQYPLNQSSFSPFPQPHYPLLQKAEYLQLSKKQRELETAVQDAKTQQAMMLELFESMAILQQGEQQRLKKCKRRCPEEIVQRHYCPHQNCSRFYASDSALKRHVRLKHDQLGDDPPERYHTLHPEPDLASQSNFIEADSENESRSGDKAAKKQVYSSIGVKCK